LAPSGPHDVTNGGPRYPCPPPNVPISSFSDHDSIQYNATDTIKALTIVFFTGELIPFISNYSLLLNALLAIPILVLISVLHLPSLLIHAPRYLNLFTAAPPLAAYPSITTFNPSSFFNIFTNYLFFTLNFIILSKGIFYFCKKKRGL